MKPLIKKVLFPLCLLLSLQSFASDSLTIISYNIFEGMRLDTTANKSLFVNWLKEQNPDILALQEVNNFTQQTLEAMARSIGHPYAILLKEDGYPVALTSKYPITGINKVVDNMHHGFIIARIKGYNILVTHLSPHKYRKRAEEIDLLMETVKSYPSQSKWMIMGDFNTYSPLDSLAYADGKLKAHVKANEEKYSFHENLKNGELDFSVIQKVHDHHFIDALKVKHPEYTATLPTTLYLQKSPGRASMRIDYVFLSPGLRRNIVSAEVIKDEFTGFYSDHYPVRLVLRQSPALSQDMQYTDARGLTMIGKAMPNNEFYHRADTSKYNNLPPYVKYLCTNSAGLGVVFKTNSNTISAVWEVAKSKPYNNMTPIVNRGLDLYIKRDDAWKFAGVARPEVMGENFSYTFVEDMEEGEKECLIYFPLYDELKALKIGTLKGSYVNPAPSPFSPKIVVYGTSITQGASASRPGLAYPAILSRKTGLDFINWGLSGSGKMEPEVADMLADIDAEVFIIDCTANCSYQHIKDRTGNLVETIRNRHPKAPIIIIERSPKESGNFNPSIREAVKLKNTLIREEYQKLIDKGIKDLHLISGEGLLGHDYEGTTTDGSHLNDLGFARFLEKVEPILLRILKKAGINIK